MPISKETLDFLIENKMRNSRDWYQAHKPQYQKYVLEPMQELVEALAPTMREIDPQLITLPKVDKTISRIYRDTRFSHDKSLYRDVMWCSFSRDKKAYPSPPGFYLEFSPSGFNYGCGYFCAPPRLMEQLRRLILREDKTFLNAKKAYEKQDVFQMEGDLYKRPKFPGAPQEYQLWLNRKGLAFIHDSQDFDLLFSRELGKTVAENMRLLKPLYEFFCQGQELFQAEES